MISNFLDIVKTKAFNNLLNDRDVLEAYNALHDRVMNECADTCRVVENYDRLEIAHKVCLCFRLQGFDTGYSEMEGSSCYVYVMWHSELTSD